MSSSPCARAALLGCLLLASLLAGGALRADPLDAYGVAASTGAAPGYLPDRVCGNCHGDLWQSYQQVGMARSFARATPEHFIEDFDPGRFHHEASGRHYRMERRGDELWFRRHTLDAQGREANVFEVRVDWILGSGNRARSYLYQTPAGELYQLPVGWYSQDAKWAMSPGFDLEDHHGVGRRVRRECMFCHNAYPEVAEGSDARRAPHLFPGDLPQGTGCQRCHGPGAGHVRAVLGGESREQVRASIVNPAKLPWPRRNDVCFQCHMLPAVEIIGPRRLDRGHYSYRPGEPLSDYLLHVDATAEGRAREDSFQINHHGYRLIQSACYRESGGEMGCTSCHDPHRKLAAGERKAWFRDRCLACHQDFAHEQPAVLALAKQRGLDSDDCARCHMPERRTEDVVEVTMTDHRIARGPFDPAALTAPRQRVLPVFTDLAFLWPEQAPQGREGTAYLALATLDAVPGRGPLATLARMLQPLATIPSPWLMELAYASLRHGRHADAATTLAVLDERDDTSPEVALLRSALALHRGQPQQALDHIASIDRANRFDPGLEFNAALAERALGRHQAAIERLRAAIALRPVFVQAWYELGQSLLHAERASEAREAFARTLAIEPAHQGAAQALSALDAGPDGADADAESVNGR